MPFPMQMPYQQPVVPVPGVRNNQRPINDLTLGHPPSEATPASVPQLTPVPLPQVPLHVGSLPLAPPEFKPEDEKLDHAKAISVEESKKKSSSEGSKSDQGGAKPAAPGTYKHRNVYKSIIRHMHSCTRKQRNELVTILMAAGFSMTDIEHAFYEIGCYNDMERQKGKKKISQSLVKRIASDKSIYTYVLRETLHNMLESWQDGKFGRLTQKNVATYKEVCTKYYNETVRVLGQPAQITSFQP